jgi:lipopolysaccharide exporter
MAIESFHQRRRRLFVSMAPRSDVMVETAESAGASPRVRSVGFAAALAGSGLIVSRGLGALAAILASRVLSSADRGRFSLASTIGQTIGIVLIFGFQSWLPRELAANNRHGQVGFLVRTVVLVYTVLGVLAIVFLRPFVAATACFAFAWVIYFLLLSVSGGVERFSLVALSGIVLGLTSIIGVLVAMAVNRVSTEGLLGIGALASVAGAVVLWPAVRSLGPPRRSGAIWRDGTRFGLPNAAADILLFALMRGDLVIVGLVLPASKVGIYAVALAFSEVLGVVPDGVATVVLPRTASNPGSINFSRVVVWATAASVAFGLVISVAARPVLRLSVGARYESAARILPVLAAATVLGGLWKLLAADGLGRGDRSGRLRSAGVGVALLAVSCPIATHRFGLAGAATASAAAYAAAAATAAQRRRRLISADAPSVPLLF